MTLLRQFLNIRILYIYMDKFSSNINLISSTNNSYYPAFRQKPEPKTTTDPIVSQVSMNGLDAIANYNAAAIAKQKNIPECFKKSLEEYIALLQSKMDTNNFTCTIDMSRPNDCMLIIKDKKNDNITDIFRYIDGECVEWENNIYQDGKLAKYIVRNKEGIKFSNQVFYRNKYPQEKFTKYGINYETTPGELMDYFEKNNIKYDCDYNVSDDNIHQVTIGEFDNNGNLVRGYWYYYGENNFNEELSWLAVSEYNNNEEEVRRIEFKNDSTEVCDYNLSKPSNSVQV